MLAVSLVAKRLLPVLLITELLLPVLLIAELLSTIAPVPELLVAILLITELLIAILLIAELLFTRAGVGTSVGTLRGIAVEHGSQVLDLALHFPNLTLQGRHMLPQLIVAPGRRTTTIESLGIVHLLTIQVKRLLAGLEVGRHRLLLAVAIDANVHLRAGILLTNEPDELFAALNALVVDRQNLVAGLNASRFSGAVLSHTADANAALAINDRHTQAGRLILTALAIALAVLLPRLVTVLAFSTFAILLTLLVLSVLSVLELRFRRGLTLGVALPLRVPLFVWLLRLVALLLGQRGCCTQANRGNAESCRKQGYRLIAS